MSFPNVFYMVKEVNYLSFIKNNNATASFVFALLILMKK